MTASIFGLYKAGDVLFYIEEDERISYLLNSRDFSQRIASNRVKVGTRVSKISLLEKFLVETKTNLKKVNGDEVKDEGVKTL